MRSAADERATRTIHHPHHLFLNPSMGDQPPVDSGVTTPATFSSGPSDSDIALSEKCTTYGAEEHETSLRSTRERYEDIISEMQVSRFEFLSFVLKTQQLIKIMPDTTLQRYVPHRLHQPLTTTV